MLFSTEPLNSALVAMLSLSIAVSAATNPAPATGKLATPVDLSKTPASAQAVFKLTGEDLHGIAASPFAQSTILVQGKAFPADEENGSRAHCLLGNAAANIKRVRYTMSIKVDSDESGASTVSEADSTRGMVIKATSGLYANSNPAKGACAKTLARHGETCASRPYIVPQSVVNKDSKSGTSSDADAGESKPQPEQKIKKQSYQKRGLNGDGKKGDAQGIADSSKPAPVHAPVYKTDVSASGVHAALTGPNATVCIDTVKRDKQVIKVVPTSAKKDISASGASLHFELVRRDEKSNLWNQIIYNDKGQAIDLTHLSLSSNMSFWRAEYACTTCKPGHQNHTVLYENVEIELDESDEHSKPTIKCEGQAQSTDVHKRDTSRYANKNQSGVEYRGAIYSIDRVALGSFDKKGNGGVVGITEKKIQPIGGVVGAQTGITKPDPAESKKAGVVQKREVDIEAGGLVEETGPIF